MNNGEWYKFVWFPSHIIQGSMEEDMQYALDANIAFLLFTLLNTKTIKQSA
jgi:hypothetical protein